MLYRIYINSTGDSKAGLISVIRAYSSMPMADVIAKIGSGSPIFEREIAGNIECDDCRKFLEFLEKLELLKCEYRIEVQVYSGKSLLYPQSGVKPVYNTITRERILNRAMAPLSDEPD
jgi:hypothetical protein